MTILRTLDGVPDRAKVEDIQEANIQYLVVSVTAAANLGTDSLLGTVSKNPVIIKSVVIHADAAQTADLTRCSIHGGATKVITFIGAADAIQANLDAENKQISWEGAVFLPVAATMVMVHTGTGGAALNLTVTIGYIEAAANGEIT